MPGGYPCRCVLFRRRAARFAVLRLAVLFVPRLAAARLAVLFAPRFAALFAPPFAPRLALFVPLVLLVLFRARGTFAPFSRASDKPIATACLRLFTTPPRPDFPRRSVPFFRRRIALATLFPAARPYFAFVDLRPVVLRVAIAVSWVEVNRVPLTSYLFRNTFRYIFSERRLEMSIV
jgi:hypothetical protein